MYGRFARHTLFAGLLLLVAVETLAQAGAVVTRDGREFLGDVRLEAPASVIIDTTAGQQKFTLGDVASVELDKPAGETTAGLPAGWKAANIGKVALPGTAAVEGGTFALGGAGWGVWSNVDSGYFVHQELDGDGQVIARVPAYAKDARVSTGIMMRASLDPSAPMSALMVDSTRQIRFNSRPLTRFTMENKPALVADRENPVWLRLTRIGSWLIAYTSDNGNAWKPIGWQQVEISETGKVLVGIMVASRFNNAVATAALDHVRIVRGDPRKTPLPFSPLPSLGIVLADGSKLPAKLEWMSRDIASIAESGGASKTRPAKEIAWVMLDPVFPDVPALFAANGPGIVLKNGDYLGGEITGVGNGWVSVESVLFGPKSYEIAKDVAAIAINAPDHWAGAYHVRTRDGVSHSAGAISIEGDRLKIGATSVPIIDVTNLIFVPKP